MTTDTHIAWIYNKNCNRTSLPWHPPGNHDPVFNISEWKFSPDKIESGGIEDTMQDLFGDVFPAGDVSYLTGTREELEAKIYGEGEQA